MPGKPARGGYTSSKTYGVFSQLSGMLMLMGTTVWATFQPPFSWKAEFVDELWLIIKRCFIPAIFANFFFGFGGPGVQGGNILLVLGTLDRLGAFFVMASVREFAPWVNGMIIAGVGGTAICADLGARKIREELAAMSVLGLDPVKTIVLPRFWALGLACPLMNIISSFAGIAGGWFAAVIVFGEATAGFIQTFGSNFTLADLFGNELKTVFFGFIISITACYKGMNTEGGAEGVGRAVNQAVVLGFVGIWIFNFVFTSILLSAFPETVNLR
jgi:phospholipid/cholesterol/gamma-HCH transport system permease protein